MQFKRGSASVPAALVGVSPTSLAARRPAPNGAFVGRAIVFGGTPKTTGETPALPKNKCIVPAKWICAHDQQLPDKVVALRRRRTDASSPQKSASSSRRLTEPWDW